MAPLAPLCGQAATDDKHIFPNISRSKGNQTVRFGQFLEYNIRNIFVQKSCGKWGSENSSKTLFAF